MGSKDVGGGGDALVWSGQLLELGEAQEEREPCIGAGNAAKAVLIGRADGDGGEREHANRDEGQEDHDHDRGDQGKALLGAPSAVVD